MTETSALYPINETHDPQLRSWVEAANQPDCEFPIQNLPFGVFWPRTSAGGAADAAAEPAGSWRVGVAIGDKVLDVAACVERGWLSGAGADACRSSSLNELLALDPMAWSALRLQLSRLLRADHAGAPASHERDAVVHALAEVDMGLPFAVGDYTDFYASIHHATNVGSMFRPDNPLLPNYRWVPIGYHGRASSIVPSGTPVRRPNGQRKGPDDAEPSFGPSRLLDYELEVGLVVGGANALGDTVPIARASERLFGLVLLNDWSARDLQAWEYQPLGPFLAKSFASTISPWVVTLEALAPFRVPAAARAADEPQPLPYLFDEGDQRSGGIDLRLSVALRTAQMRAEGAPAFAVSASRFRDLYWTPAQMLAHHASNGCNLRPGDLLGSGTVSGPEPESRGCLLERTWRGSEPLALPTGESRTFLADGDEVQISGLCKREGFASIGFGVCSGVITAAPDFF
jgi:fumarylacetoacetase